MIDLLSPGTTFEKRISQVREDGSQFEVWGKAKVIANDGYIAEYIYEPEVLDPVLNTRWTKGGIILRSLSSLIKMGRIRNISTSV